MSFHILLPIVLVVAKVLGEAVRRVGMPAVVGEILAGVLLGPAVYGLIPSELQDPAGYDLVHQLAQIGLCVLLFRIGLETHFEDFWPVWPQASGIALTGMVLPFGLGWGLVSVLGWPQATAVFAGATLTATSIGITMAVLAEIGAQASREGTLILGAAVLDDILGLLLLSAVVASMTPDLSVLWQIARAVSQAVAFLAAGIFVGPLVVRVAVRLAQWSQTEAMLLVLAFSYFLLLAYAAETAGLAMIIGAYAAGLAFARHSDREWLDQQLQPLIALLPPLFFVLVGASVSFTGFDPWTIQGRQTLGIASLLFFVAIIGKVFAAFWLRGEINKWAIGWGLVPRGEMGLVFVQVGLQTGVLSTDLFSALTLVIIGTSVISPILVRVSWQHPCNAERENHQASDALRIVDPANYTEE